MIDLIVTFVGLGCAGVLGYLIGEHRARLRLRSYLDAGWLKLGGEK